jgi:uncharacterized protein YbjT (DUF2867 family)
MVTMPNSDPRESILVVGASGRTGRYVLRYLGAASVPAIACVRRADRLPSERYAAAHEVAIADVEQPFTLRPLFERAAHVIYVAGSDRKSLSPGAWQLEVDCLASCLELAQRAGLPGRWVYVGFSGEARGATNWAETRWRELKVAAEDAVAASGLNYFVLRTARVTDPVNDEPRVAVSQRPVAAQAELPCNVLAFLLTGAVLGGAAARSRAVVGIEPSGQRLQPAVQAFARLQPDSAGLHAQALGFSRA